MGNLINGHGKGLSVYSRRSGPGFSLVQWDTRGSIHISDLWSWNETSLGSGDRSLCNGFGKCATSIETKVSKNSGTLNSDQMGRHNKLIQLDYSSNEEGQQFYFLNLVTHPGFYAIKDKFGKCIGVPENTDKDWAEIRACYCNSSEAGQRWQWHYFDDKCI